MANNIHIIRDSQDSHPLFGIISLTGVLFDGFVTHKGDARDPSVPRFSGTIDMAIVSNELVTTGTTRGGIVLDTPRGHCPPMLRIATRSVGSESRTDNSTGGTYRIQAVVDRNGGLAIDTTQRASHAVAARPRPSRVRRVNGNPTSGSTTPIRILDSPPATMWQRSPRRSASRARGVVSRTDRVRYDTANESIVLSSVANGTWSTKATYYFEPAVGDDVTVVIGYNNDTPSDW